MATEAQIAWWHRPWRALGGGGAPPIVPQPRLAGPMPWVIAIMVAMTVIAAAAGLALSNVSGAASDELAGGITVQVAEPNPLLRQQQAAAVVRRLQAMPGVHQVRAVPPEEIERLIEPWLGASVVGDTAVPVPALVDARLRGGVDGGRLGALRRALREVAPAARVDAQSGWLGPVFSALQSLQWLALALISLLAVATCAVVLLAVRTALGANRGTIEIVHLLGGSDRQIAGVFQKRAGFDAAFGALLGLALGGCVVLVLGRQFASLGAGLAGQATLGWVDWVVLALVPLIGVALAVVTARFTVLRALRQML